MSFSRIGVLVPLSLGAALAQTANPLAGDPKAAGAGLAIYRRHCLGAANTTQEQVRDAQTGILKSISAIREDTGIRFRALDVKISNTQAELRARTDVMEKRLGQIETKLRIDPSAA